MGDTILNLSYRVLVFQYIISKSIKSSLVAILQFNLSRLVGLLVILYLSPSREIGYDIMGI